MTIAFFPQGIPNSSSFSINANFTQQTSVGGFPVTASLSEYVINYQGPVGPSYETVSATLS